MVATSKASTPTSGISVRADIVHFIFEKVRDRAGIEWRTAWMGPILQPAQHSAPAFYVFDIEERLKEQPAQNCMDPSLCRLTLLFEFWAALDIDEFASDGLNRLLVAIQRTVYDDPTLGGNVKNLTELGNRFKVVEDKGRRTVVGEITFQGTYSKSLGPLTEAT